MECCLAEVVVADEELVEAMARLLPQLTAVPPPTLEKLRRIAASDATRLYVAREGESGPIVGVLTLALFQIPTGVRAWIEDLVVEERARGQGVGERLTEMAVAAARAAGAGSLELTSHPARVSAHRLYQRLGFQIRETTVYRLPLHSAPVVPGDVVEGIEIRPFRFADEAGVVALWQLVFADDPAHNEPRAIIRRKLSVQPQLFLVAVRNQEIVGTIVGGFDGVRGWLHHLAVADGERGRGLASVLVGRVEKDLARIGCTKVNLQVRASNAEVARFYEGLGYRSEDRLSFGKLLNETDEVVGAS